MLRLGIDIMGGDYAPRETTLGAIAAFNDLPGDVRLVLIGNKEEILKILEEKKVSPSGFEIVHTTEVIDMAENPTRAIQQKPYSSLATGFRLLKEGRLDAFSSAGNTGAML